MFCSIILGALFTVIHSTDGGVDDFATSALIAAAHENSKQQENNSFDFPAIIITNADCEPVSALSAYQKTIQLLNMPTQVALSYSRVWTPFPWTWRMDSEAVNQLECLKNQTSNTDILLSDGNLLFVNTLRNSINVKIIATGPLTTIADVFKNHRELIGKVSELHWMGGAIDISGNIMESPEIPKELLNDKAEWNVFCDPAAADWVFRNTSFAIFLYPLDISDSTIPADFLNILKQKNETVYSNYITESYKLVERVQDYRMWDVVAVSGVLFPEVLMPPIKENLSVVLNGKEEGAIIRDSMGREIYVYKEFKNNDPNIFYHAVAEILASPLLK